jgi:outer membrane protein assembly factor BamB
VVVAYKAPMKFKHCVGSLFSGCVLLTLGFVPLATPSAVSAGNWPAWRGPSGLGLVQENSIPIRWSAAENVRWKTALPEPGNSSPIVWGNRIFVTQALEKENRRTLICLNRATGKQLWQTGTDWSQKEDTHETNPYCAASPVTDGEQVIAWFGSAGLFSYNFEGKELWRRDLGKQTHQWGYAASPVLHRNLCILHFGPGERSFLIALDKKTGKTVWQIDLPELRPMKRQDGFAGQEEKGVIGSLSTPLIVRTAGRDELILTSPEKVRAFDPMTGLEFWSCGGLNPLVYTSPVYGEGVVVAMGGFMGTTIAVRPGGQGDVTDSRKLWTTGRTKNRLGSAVITGGHVYVLNMDGIAECIDLKTGAQVWAERLKGPGAKTDSWSSLVLAGEHIYALNQSGDTIVFKAKPKFEVVSVNPLDGELTNSSPAVSNGEIFVRTHKHLWCIGDSAGNKDRAQLN